jgi:two-component sensor histidine kinase/CheY-like chemotaxis protein
MLKVMIAEDDLIIADLLEDVLVEKGYEVCGIARTVDEAVELGKRTQPDLAILDLRLANGGLGTEVAAQLEHQGRLGVLYATGNLGQIELTKADGEACLGKPYRPRDVVRALEIVEQLVTGSAASRPFPPGFRLLDPAPGGVQKTTAKSRPSPEEVGRLLRQQTALAKFGSFAFRESDLGKVLTEAARVCAEGLNVPFCKVCRHRPEEQDLLVEAGVGWHQGVIGCVVSRADETSPQGRAFITGQPVICPDLSKDATFLLPAFYAEHGIVSTLDVVITAENQPYGVLEIDNPVAHTYDQQDIDFLTGFANVVATAVITSKRNTILQRTVQQMHDMVADRDRLLIAKNQVLEEKNSLLDDKTRLLDEKGILAQELQHRVRNNLQLVYGMLDKQLQNGGDAAGKAGISAIARRVMSLAQVYDHLLGTGLSRTIEFSAYLSSLCTGFKAVEDAQHPNIELVYEGEPVTLDLDTVTALGLATAELLSNGYLHAFPAGTGKISVALRRSAQSATLSVDDDGVGMPGTQDDKRHGLGLVRRLMEQVGGTAEVRSDHGTLWTLEFPVPPISTNGAAKGTRGGLT